MVAQDDIIHIPTDAHNQCHQKKADGLLLRVPLAISNRTAPLLFVRSARVSTMPFHRQQPPSSSSTVPLEHTSSSSSSIPSLTSDASTSSTESEALVPPLQQLSLGDRADSPKATHKPEATFKPSISLFHTDRAIDDTTLREHDTRENIMLDREPQQDRRSIGREGKLSQGREGKSPTPWLGRS